jgi:ABC-type nickel/cobalt efflux system permease component RcnA
MTETQSNGPGFFTNRAGRVARGILAAVIAIAFLGLVFFLAAMLTVAFFVVAGIAILAGGAYWLWRKVRGRKAAEGPEILVATHGPKGWTVNGSENSES